MARRPGVLAIDQGTTSTRAIVFDRATHAVASAQQEFPQLYPRDGWVEHDPEAIWESTVEVCRRALAAAETAGAEVIGAGLTNQRETVVLWDRASGRPVHNAIVWQDRRTAERCRRLVEQGHEALVQERTGLVIDPYFSATKLEWLLEHVPGAHAGAQRGELAFGTIDSFLLWRLSGGRVHATDVTNAARTMLFDIHSRTWDPDLLALFGVPEGVLPEVYDNVARFATISADAFGRALPLAGMAGDQQAATVGQVCFEPGMIKATLGTGCFALLNTGPTPVRSRNRLLTTIAYRIGNATTYALEGSIFVAGAAVQWLRDALGVIRTAADTEELAAGLEADHGVYLVPAFTGLGAPHWNPDARGALFGLRRDTGAPELARAALESVAFQLRDLVRAMERDTGSPVRSLRADGGMAVNEWLLQFIADILDMPVERPRVTETTALGAAILAGLELGLFDSLDDAHKRWQREAQFRPRLGAAERGRLVAGWERAVAAALSH